MAPTPDRFSASPEAPLTMTDLTNCDRWLWTELLAFDIEQADLGVDCYLQELGFTPEGISLLISSPDVILQHEGLEHDAPLPASFCTRFGHPGNERRKRQAWTRFLLRDLVRQLRERGIKVFFSNFTEYQNNQFHEEWMRDYPEAGISMAVGPYETGHGPNLYVLSRLKDGRNLRDIVAPQIVRVCVDYGFDGWHGADCCCGHNPLWISSCNDGMIEQYLEWGGRDLPPIVTEPCGWSQPKMRARLAWLWEHRRLEWIEFHTDLWAAFWREVCTGLHAAGREAYVNSSLTRDPFEARYRMGFDYRKIASAGVNGIFVETVAGGLMLYEDKEYHHEYLSMLMHLKACVPDTKLIFLHNIKDVVENWDLLRHAPPLFEREVYSLANVFHITPSGERVRDADGLLACLADGIEREEWQWIRKRWELAFSPLPTEVIGGTLVWSDEALERFMQVYPSTRIPSAQKLTQRLLEHNAPISATVGVHGIEHINGPLIILNPANFPDEEREQILQSGKVIIAIGPDLSGWPESPMEFADHLGPFAQRCRIYGATIDLPPHAELKGDGFPAAVENLPETTFFQQELPYRPVSPEFLTHCAKVIHSLSTGVTIRKRTVGILEAVDGSVTELAPTHFVIPTPLKVSAMFQKQPDGALRIALKNSENGYAYPQVTLPCEIESACIRSLFPITQVFPQGNTFTTIVPPRGIVVVDVRLRT